jgi:hypothetical protein
MRIRLLSATAITAAVSAIGSQTAAPATPSVLPVALSAQAAEPGGWTQITHAHSGAKSNLGLARGRDGTLHVLWAGPARAPFKAILDTPISPSGAIGRTQAVVSGWSAVHPPAAATAPDGSVHAVVSGAKTGGSNDPYDGLNDIAGPGNWKPGPHAFGHFQITEASNADVRSAFLKNGQLVSVWGSAASMLFQAGTDPNTAPQNLTPKELATSPVIAVDQGSGQAVIAYHGVNTGHDYFQRVLPSVGPSELFPSTKLDSPQIAGRIGGGVYTAYTPDGVKVWLLRFGSRQKTVPVPKGARVLTAGLATGPEGRLWVFYGDEKTTYSTRSNKSVTRYEPVQKFNSPPGTVQYFRLEGEGSAGPLDVFADITVDGQARDGSYQHHVLALFSLGVAKKALKNKAGKTTAVKVTVRVADAGDGVAGAKVAGLPVGAKTTDAKGAIVFTVSAAKHGAFKLTATKAGYQSAGGTLTL